jgi:hypothetical protein
VHVALIIAIRLQIAQRYRVFPIPVEVRIQTFQNLSGISTSVEVTAKSRGTVAPKIGQNCNSGNQVPLFLFGIILCDDAATKFLKLISIWYRTMKTWCCVYVEFYTSKIQASHGFQISLCFAFSKSIRSIFTTCRSLDSA